MIDQREILWGVLAPPVLMAIGMAATAYLPAARRFLSTGALLALVFGISQLGFRGWTLPGNDVHNWPAWIAFAAGLIAWCSACGQGPLVWRVIIRLALTGVATWLLLRPQLQHGGTGTAVMWIGGTAVVWTALMLLWERAHAATTARLSVMVLAVLAGLSAASLLLFNSLTHAQYGGILTAALVAAAAVSWWKPSWYQQAGPVTVSAVVLPTLWLLGQRYADLPLWTLVFLALAGLAPLAGSLPLIRHWPEWKRLLVVILVTGVVVLPVIIWGVITSVPAASESSYGY